MGRNLIALRVLAGTQSPTRLLGGLIVGMWGLKYMIMFMVYQQTNKLDEDVTYVAKTYAAERAGANSQSKRPTLVGLVSDA